MDAARERVIGPAGATPTDQTRADDGPVRVRANLMTGLGVAARLARLGAPEGSGGVAGKTDNPGRMPRTKRLAMRLLTVNDRTEFLRVLRLSRGHLAEFCPLGTEKETTGEQVFDRQLALGIGAQRTGRALRVIALDTLGLIVGGFNINDITRGLEHTGELVFWLSADAQRRGYAEEGVRGMLELAFADLPLGLGLHRVVALIAPKNEPCRRLARKVGLVQSASAAPVELMLGERRVVHDVYEVFATIGPGAESLNTGGHVVEGKPSMAEDVLGRGLLRILRTESERGG